MPRSVFLPEHSPCWKQTFKLRPSEEKTNSRGVALLVCCGQTEKKYATIKKINMNCSSSFDG